MYNNFASFEFFIWLKYTNSLFPDKLSFHSFEPASINEVRQAVFSFQNKQY